LRELEELEEGKFSTVAIKDGEGKARSEDDLEIAP